MSSILKLFCSFTMCIGLLGANVQAAPIVIDTMPTSSADQTSGYSAWANDMWRDLAVGFTVSSAGYIRHVDTLLGMSSLSIGSAYFGIATNALIGSPVPNYFEPVPGGVWKTSFCTTEARPSTSAPSSLPTSACAGYDIQPSTVRLDAGETLSVDLDLYLPSAGTYWFYTTFKADDVWLSWGANRTLTTDLLAQRSGHDATGPQTTFNLFPGSTGGSTLYTPGFRIEFDADVPEPLSILTVGSGLALLAGMRRRKSLESSVGV